MRSEKKGAPKRTPNPNRETNRYARKPEMPGYPKKPVRQYG